METQDKGEKKDDTLKRPVGDDGVDDDDNAQGSKKRVRTKE